MSSPAASNIARRTSSAALSRSVTESAETGSAISALADSLIRPPIRVTVYPARIIAPHASRAKDSIEFKSGRVEEWKQLRTSTLPLFHSFCYLRFLRGRTRAGGLGCPTGLDSSGSGPAPFGSMGAPVDCAFFFSTWGLYTNSYCCQMEIRFKASQ